jgi:hypothetical protein
MKNEKSAAPATAADSTGELLDFDQIEAEYKTPKKATAYVWACQNRYGFRDIVIKVGRRSRVRRGDFEAWLTTRRGITE